MKIGACWGFLCVSPKEPWIVIGPDFHVFLLGYCFFVLVCGAILYESTLMDINVIDMWLIVLTCIIQLLSYLLVATRNPGIANKGVSDEMLGSLWFCTKCNMKQVLTTRHCSDCAVCIQEFDHHCPWVGKCVGKGNLSEFYSFLYSTVTFMIYNIIIFTS